MDILVLHVVTKMVWNYLVMKYLDSVYGIKIKLGTINVIF